MSQQTTVPLIWKIVVSLSDGREISHQYDITLPEDPDAWDEAVKSAANSVIKEIFEAFTGKVPLFFLQNLPTLSLTGYNPAHVASVRFEVIGPKQLAEIILQAQRKMGFVKR